MIEATTSRMASLSLPSGASICHRYKASVATIGSMKESVAYHFSCFVIIGGLQSAFAEQVQPEQVKRTPGDLGSREQCHTPSVQASLPCWRTSPALRWNVCTFITTLARGHSRTPEEPQQDIGWRSSVAYVVQVELAALQRACLAEVISLASYPD